MFRAYGYRRYPAIRRHEPGTMNRLEQDFAAELELRKKAGEIQEYQFEAVKLRLAKNCFYTFDFLVVTDHRAAVQIHSQVTQRPGQITRVRVLYLPEQQFGANGDQFGNGHQNLEWHDIVKRRREAGMPRAELLPLKITMPVVSRKLNRRE